MRRTIASLAAALAITALAAPASAQYAVGHRTFGAGTAGGGGFWKMDYKFPGIDPDKPIALLPTLELKFFLADTLSLDFHVPVANIAFSQMIQDYFFFTGEAFLNFHPSAPSPFELFIAPGLGFTYAKWDGEEDLEGQEASGYAFHIPVRVGFEFNNAKRNMSLFLAVRPFFALAHQDGTEPGGGVFFEIGLMAYATRYRADRY